MVSAKPPEVLLAEDDALIAMSLREVLSLLSGFEVVGVAASVTDALCVAQNTQPDLAIFDVQLRGKRDGIEGAALIRDILDIPVVFLTAQGDERTKARANALHPAAYLRKPVSPQQIVSAVTQALRSAE